MQGLKTVFYYSSHFLVNKDYYGALRDPSTTINVWPT